MSVTVPIELEADDLLHRLGDVVERLFPADSGARARVRVHIDAVRFHLLAVLALAEGDSIAAGADPAPIRREPESWWQAVNAFLWLHHQTPLLAAEESAVSGGGLTAEQAANRIMRVRAARIERAA